jgi:hypothetical protein
VNEPDISVEQNTNDPTLININIKMAHRSRNLVVIDPAKEQTHDWAEGYKKGVYKCTKCGMNKERMNSKEVDDSIASDYLTVADYNYTCDEMSVKDIIE